MEEKKHLSCKKSGQYDYSDTPCIQSVPELDTQGRVVEDRRVKSKSVKAASPPRASRFTPPSVEEVRVYCAERKNSVDPERFVDFYASKGWLVGKSKMKDGRAAVRSWERSDSQQKMTSKDRIRSYDADESFV